MASVLVVAAHPDDEVLGCGGTLALHAERGDRVEVLILGEGMRSREEYDPDDVRRLHGAAREAAELLGANLRLEALPDQRFDTVPLLEVIRAVEGHVADVEPDVVYTHHPGDLNADHGVTTRAVLTALRPMPDRKPVAVLAFETLSSSEWNYSPALPRFRPQWYVDITSTIELKTAALEAYATEIRDWPHPRSSEGVRVAARRFGMEVGVGYAEAFEVMRIGPGPLPGIA